MNGIGDPSLPTRIRPMSSNRLNQQLTDKEVVSMIRSTLQPEIDKLSTRLSRFRQEEKALQIKIAELEAQQGVTVNSASPLARHMSSILDTLPD